MTNNLITILLAAAISLCCAPCKSQTTGNVAASGTAMSTDKAVKSLIQQVKEGDAEACKSLARCYSKGKGVKRSFINAYFMYGIYGERTGVGIDSVATLFDDNDPYKTLAEMLSAPKTNGEKEMREKIERLKQTLPATAELIEASIKFDEVNDTTAFQNALNKAENEGGDVCIFFKLYFYDTYGKAGDALKYMRLYADRWPAFNKAIAESYMDEYEKDGDIENVKRAMECYRKMDEHGMLNASAASQMLKTYLEFKGKGLPQWNKKDLERIKKLADSKKTGKHN